MYRGFLIDSGFLDKSFSSMLESSSLDIDRLAELFLSNEEIDVKAISDLIFPENKHIDIFISHSFNDRDKAATFSNKLKQKELNVFIDSEVWGSVYQLLKAIDNKYCYQSNSETYNYDKRNITTSNVYMVLNSALCRMIDKAECFMFIASNNSLNLESLSSQKQDKQTTSSPWIHSELLFSSMCRKNQPARLKRYAQDGFKKIYESASLESMPVFKHPAELEHLTPLDEEVLKKLLRSTKRETAVLDELYQLTSSSY